MTELTLESAPDREVSSSIIKPVRKKSLIEEMHKLGFAG
jgi:hypothetical protein